MQNLTSAKQDSSILTPTWCKVHILLGLRRRSSVYWHLSDLMATLRSEKYIWDMASSADIRCTGLHTRSLCNRSRPLAVNLGATWEKDMLGWYIGNGLKSGRRFIPGQVSSVGVPRSLKIRLSWSSTSEPGNRGRPALASSENKRKSLTHPRRH